MNTGMYPYTKETALQSLGLQEKPHIDRSGISNIRVELVTDDSKLLAYVSYNHYGIVVTGIQILQGDRGVYIKYPDFLRNDGTRQSYFFPVNSAVTNIVENAIHEEFKRKRTELMEKLGWKRARKKKPA